MLSRGVPFRAAVFQSITGRGGEGGGRGREGQLHIQREFLGHVEADTFGSINALTFKEGRRRRLNYFIICFRILVFTIRRSTLDTARDSVELSSSTTRMTFP